jgi:hypothetical protein
MNDDMIGLILSGAIVILLFVLSMVLRSGNGAALINIYSIMPEKKKALYDEKALCRFSGNLLLLADILLIPGIIAGVCNIAWLAITICLAMIIILIIAAIYSFTNDRFRKHS